MEFGLILNITNAAKYLGKSRESVDKLIKMGKIQTVIEPPFTTRKILKSELERYAESLKDRRVIDKKVYGVKVNPFAPNKKSNPARHKVA